VKRLDPFTVSLSGVHLVEASAGTGKTHAITSLYLRAVIERDLLPSQLLVVTFTRAAAAEIRSRIRARLHVALEALSSSRAPDDAALGAYLAGLADVDKAMRALRRALDGIDEAALFTIHGFCQRVLEHHAFDSQMRFDVTLLESLDSLRDEAINDGLVQELATANPAVLRRFVSNAGAARTAQLVHSLAARPDLGIAPQEPMPTRLDQAIAAFRQAQEVARHHYEAQRILDILSTAPGLNRAKVAPKRLPARLAQIEVLLEPGAESEPWPQRCVLQYSVLEQCLNKGCAKAPEHPFFHACDELREAHRTLDDQLTQAAFALQRACAKVALTFESERKESLAVQGFDDLLLNLRRAIGSPNGETLAHALRERYPLAMIDEFQDTDPVQTALFSRLYAGAAGGLFLIGDPKQSIYSFRGADLHAYLTASALEDLSLHGLDVNWRCDPGLIQAINALYSGISNPFLLSSIRYRSIQPRPLAHDLFDDDGQSLTGLGFAFIDSGTGQALDRKTARQRSAAHAALAVQDLLTRRVQGRPVAASGIAILTRTNAEAEQVQEALGAVGVSSALATDTSVFSTRDADGFLLLLRAMSNPNNSSYVASALLSPLLGLAASELASRLKDASAWDQDVERFIVANDLLRRHGIFAAAQFLLDEYDVVVRLLRTPGGERRMTNLYHLLELTEIQRVEHNLQPAALLRWLLTVQQDPSEVASEARQLRIESDEQSVVITTVHRSKGLEFPFVLCPFLWADTARTPDKNHLLVYRNESAQQWVVDLRGKGAPATALAAAVREQEAEALRLLYVAITRAKHWVSVHLPNVKGLQCSALGRFLCERTGLSTADDISFHELRRRLLAMQAGAPALPRVSVPGAMPEGVESARPLSIAPLTRHLSNSWAASSFSALVAGQPAHSLSTQDEEGKDVDALVAPPQLGEGNSAFARFSALAPGSASGDTLHKILESIDFANFDPASDTIISRQLARLGPEAQRSCAQVQQDMRAVLQVPLLASNPTFTLRSIDRRRRLSELQFSMGLGFDAQGRVRQHVSAAQLAAAMTPDATGLDATYQNSVRQLGFEPLAGFLRGFIDLVFEHDQLTYVLDYKSTSISDRIAGFTPALVAKSVAENHYALQTALYSLVMHRYLRRRKPDYDYDRDFGGTLVVYLRGLCPTQPPGHAVFFHRASRAGIETLDRLFWTEGAA
jgi:exodeoxyribonuclease V beta subunit